MVKEIVEFLFGGGEDVVGVVALLGIGADVAREVQIDHEQGEFVQVALGLVEGLERGLKFLLSGELVALAGHVAAAEAYALVDGGEDGEYVEASHLGEVDAFAGLVLFFEGEVDEVGFHLFGGILDAVSCRPRRPPAEVDEVAENVVIFLGESLPHEPFEDLVVGCEDVCGFVGFDGDVCVVAELEVETDFLHKFDFLKPRITRITRIFFLF